MPELAFCWRAITQRERRGGSELRPSRWHFRSSGHPPKITVDIDCSITPEICPSTKPGQNKLTMIGATTWQDVIDYYCYDEMDNCSSGPEVG